MNVEMKNICFCFGKNRVLNNVDFKIKGGEITALLGENGAGKSTLMNILGGILRTADGNILIDGVSTAFTSPNDAINMGIGFIHQELNMIDDLTVYENMFISDFPKKGLFLDKAKMIAKTQELFDSLGIEIEPRAFVRDLDVSYKQICEIGRVLMQNAKIIIMDEPTTSLTDSEVKRIFKIMRSLKEKGVGIVFISHKLNEVMEICDTYTVLRNGEPAMVGSVSDTTIKEISEHLMGHGISDSVAKRVAKYGDEVLRLENLSDGKYFNNISLSVRKGQILGVTGLLGDGRGEIFRTVFGSRNPKYSGKIIYCGHEIKPRGTYKSAKMGIDYVPSDRKSNGIIKDLSVIDNTTIVNLENMQKSLFIDNSVCAEKFKEQKYSFKIKAENPDNPITSLSGGNQQKAVIAKWIMANPTLLILDNPTQGVDVGAKAEIYAKIKQLADMGVAIIWLSPEAQEITENCESAYVLFHGKIAGYLEGDSLNESAIMNYATGGISLDNV